MTDLRDKIARIVADEKNGGDPYDIAEDIIAALPDMVAPLVWSKGGVSKGGGAKYNIYESARGWDCVCYPYEEEQYRLADRGTPQKESEVKAAAQADYAAAVVAVFTGSK